MENQIAQALSEQTYPVPAPKPIIIDRQACAADSPLPDSERLLENELILGCARTIVDAELADRIKDLVGQDIDWSYLIRTASRNGVMPLVCLNLINICPSRMPAKVLMDCREFWRDHARQNLFQTAELLRILRVLDSHNILALPLKGPALAACAYRNLSLRQFCDLDIFVPKRDMRASIDLLTSNGFKVASSPTWFQRLPTPASRKKDYGLISDDGQIRVELHWRLSGPHFDLPVDLEDLWERLETVPLAGSLVRSLPLEDLLLYLTLHGSRHGWERLLFVCDIAEIIWSYHDQIDWSRLLTQASDLGSKRSLILGLHLANELLGAHLPAEIVVEIGADPILKQLTAQIRDHLFRVDEVPPTLTYWQNYHLRVKERLRERMRLRLHYSIRYLCLASTPNAKDRALIALPKYLTFGYYILRLIRLIKKM